MPITTIYADPADNSIKSMGTTWDARRAGTGTKALASVSGTSHQDVGFVPAQYLSEVFFPFPTSALARQEILSVAFSIYCSDLTWVGGGSVFDLRATDCGAAVDIGDWVAGAGWGSKALCASKTGSTFTSDAYNTFTSDSGFAAAINTGGTTWLVLALGFIAGTVQPSDDRLMDIKSADEAGTTADPKLVIEHKSSGDTIWLGANM